MPAGARLDALAATVALWRTCADLEHASDAQWQTAVTRARGFLRRTRDELAAYLGGPAPAPDPSLESTAPPALSSARCPTLPALPPDEEPEPQPEPPAPATLTVKARFTGNEGVLPRSAAPGTRRPRA